MKALTTSCFAWLWLLNTLPLWAQQVNISFADTTAKTPLPPTVTSLKFTNRDSVRTYTLLLFNSKTGQKTDGIGNADIVLPTDGIVQIKATAGKRSLFSAILPPNAVLQVSSQGGGGQGGIPPAATPATDSIELIPFNDARRLKALLAPTTIADSSKAKIRSYLLKYFDIEGKPDTLAALIANNTFLKNAGIDSTILSNNSSIKPLLTAGVSLAEASAKMAGSQAGFGLSPTAVADALGTFIAKRFKEEINVAFVKRFRTLLADRRDSLRLLFPETANVLLNNDPYNYTSFLETLQESFQQDLEALPTHTIDYAVVNRSRISQKIRADSIRFNAGFDATLAALQIVSALRDDKAITQVLGQFGTSKAVLAMKTPALKSTFQVISMLARNGTTDEAGETFLTKDQVKELADDKLLNLFLGLMLAKEKPLLNTINIPVLTGSGSTTLAKASLYTVINSLNTKLPDFRKTISTIYSRITAMKDVRTNIVNERNRGNTKPNLAPLYLDLLSKGIGILQQGVTLYASLTTVGRIPAVPNGFNTVFNTAQLCIPVVQNLVTKQYGVALTHSVILLQKLFETKLMTTTAPAPIPDKKAAKLARRLYRLRKDMGISTFDSLVHSKAITRSKAIDSIAIVIRSSLAKADTLMTIEIQTAQDNDLKATLGDGRPGGAGLLGDLMKYGSFMVTVVKAETKDEMLQALESAALPVGSYRIKRNNYFSVSLNSFGGAYAGLRQGQGLLAPSAPVGVYAGWGTSQVCVRQRDNFAKGIFVSLIDVGAVAAFRLNDQTSAIPDVTWQNFISPGAYFVFGFRNVLSLGLGAQYGPQLTAIKDGMNITEPKAWRVGIKFTADIPIFNLHTKANRKGLATL